MRAAAARLNDDKFSGRSVARMPLAFIWAFMMLLVRLALRRPLDSIAGVVAGCAAIAILSNALFMQSGPHPAPIFVNKPMPVTQPAAVVPQRKAGDGGGHRIERPAQHRAHQEHQESPDVRQWHSRQGPPAELVVA